MNVINAFVHVGEHVAFPTQRPGGGLAMQIGMIEELHPESGKIRVKPVYNTTRGNINKDGTYASKVVLAELCVHVTGWNE
jgi:hypothetical protein